MKSFQALVVALTVAIAVPAAAKQDQNAPLAVMHGIYHSPLFSPKGIQTGYATIVLDAGKLVHFQKFERYSAPYEVQREVETASAYEIPHTTLVYEDSVNAYYYTTFPNAHGPIIQ